MGANSLSHTRWDCRDHILFIPKYRRKTFFKRGQKGDRGHTEDAV